MLTSPTVSAPSSPSAFYHAARRHSPRFLPSRSAISSQSPVLTYTQSPQTRRREYTDAGTQYTPEGFPPTYRRPVPDAASLVALPIADSRRGKPSATPTVITEPPEPDLRIDPQPAVLNKSSESETHDGKQRAEQSEASTADQVQSPAKRVRPQGQSVQAPPPSPKRSRVVDPPSSNQQPKILPRDYAQCSSLDLGILISEMLMELVRLNDGIPLRDGQLTRFHSRAPPGISVKDYLFRLIVHATLSPPILLSMVFYVDKLCTMYPAFTISSLTVHRFLITAATVAAKGLSDSFWTNSLYAKVGGVSLRELALLELEFLRKLDWRIVPKPETLVDYYKGLVERGEGYVMEKQESAPTPASVVNGQVNDVAIDTQGSVDS